MKLAALALSTVLLCGTGAFAQTSAPATAPSGSSTTNSQAADPNGGAMQNNTAPNGMDNTNPNGINNTNPNGTMNNGRHRHWGGGGWGLWGLLGLFGFFGLAGGGRRNRDDVVATTTPRTRL